MLIIFFVGGFIQFVIILYDIFSTQFFRVKDNISCDICRNLGTASENDDYDPMHGSYSKTFSTSTRTSGHGIFDC